MKKTTAQQDNEVLESSMTKRTCFICRDTIQESVSHYRVLGGHYPMYRHVDCPRKPRDPRRQQGKAGAQGNFDNGRVFRGRNSLGG